MPLHWHLHQGKPTFCRCNGIGPPHLAHSSRRRESFQGEDKSPRDMPLANVVELFDQRVEEQVEGFFLLGSANSFRLSSASSTEFMKFRPGSTTAGADFRRRRWNFTVKFRHLGAADRTRLLWKTVVFMPAANAVTGAEPFRHGSRFRRYSHGSIPSFRSLSLMSARSFRSRSTKFLMPSLMASSKTL